MLESFKTGIKGIWNFKLIVIALLLFQIAISFLIAVPNVAIHDVVTLVFYIIPAIIMFFMSCSYSLSEIPAKSETENGKESRFE